MNRTAVGLTRQSNFHNDKLFKMDARVKPAHDMVVGATEADGGDAH
jgi:hypothetical protein